MKKRYKIPLIFIIIITPFILYGLHLVKKAEAVISDGKIIEGDGAGPYLDGPQYVIVGLSENAFEFSTYDYTRGFDGNFGDRYVFVDFINAKWKDENYTDIHPKIPSMRYHGSISFYIENADILKMVTGERLEPNGLGIWLRDRGSTHDMICQCQRNMLWEEINDSIPTASLYNEGHAYIEKASGDFYVLDVDAWFKTNEYDENGSLITDITYYIRLSFRITITLKGLI